MIGVALDLVTLAGMTLVAADVITGVAGLGLAAAGVAGAWIGTFVIPAAGGPAWTVGLAVLTLLASLGAVAATGARWVARDSGEGSDDDGGAGCHPPAGRPPGGGDSDQPPDAPDGPAWWPQFERDLAAYVERVAREPVGAGAPLRPRTSLSASTPDGARPGRGPCASP